MTSWNKFCFTGGILEAAVSLPGANNIMGLWPAVWAMGNLGKRSPISSCFYVYLYIYISQGEQDMALVLMGW